MKKYAPYKRLFTESPNPVTNKLAGEKPQRLSIKESAKSKLAIIRKKLSEMEGTDEVTEMIDTVDKDLDMYEGVSTSTQDGDKSQAKSADRSPKATVDGDKSQGRAVGSKEVDHKPESAMNHDNREIDGYEYLNNKDKPKSNGITTKDMKGSKKYESVFGEDVDEDLFHPYNEPKDEDPYDSVIEAHDMASSLDNKDEDKPVTDDDTMTLPASSDLGMNTDGNPDEMTMNPDDEPIGPDGPDADDDCSCDDDDDEEDLSLDDDEDMDADSTMKPDEEMKPEPAAM